MKKIIKTILWFIGIIIGVSLFSVSLYSFDLCSKNQKNIYKFNSSGIVLPNSLNKTIYIGNTLSDVNTWIHVCEGKLKVNNIYFLKDKNCTDRILIRGVPYKDIIKDTILQLNTDELEVTEKGFFCLGRKIYA